MTRKMLAKEAIKLLKENGFEFISQKGSHQKFCSGKLCVTVVYHRSPKEELSTGIIKSILSAVEKSKLQKK